MRCESRAQPCESRARLCQRCVLVCEGRVIASDRMPRHFAPLQKIDIGLSILTVRRGRNAVFASSLNEGQKT